MQRCQNFRSRGLPSIGQTHRLSWCDSGFSARCLCGMLVRHWSWAPPRNNGAGGSAMEDLLRMMPENEVRDAMTHGFSTRQWCRANLDRLACACLNRLRACLEFHARQAMFRDVQRSSFAAAWSSISVCLHVGVRRCGPPTSTYA